MNVVDILVTVAGPVLARMLLLRWIGNSEIAEELTGGLREIITRLVNDKRTQHRAERIFSDIGEEVAASLSVILSSEGIDISEERAEVVAEAVVATLPHITIDTALRTMLLEHNLQADLLSKHLIQNYRQNRELDPSEEELYKRIVTEACERVIAISASLPNFEPALFSDLLKRNHHLTNVAEETLLKLNKLYEDAFSQRGSVTIHEKRFDHNYRQAIVNKLDNVEIIGLDVRNRTSHKQPLSVAYITLKLLEDNSMGISVNASLALANARRVLITGEAGSGKTTLLKWIAVRVANNDFNRIAIEMQDWQDSIPFFIRLRDFAKKEVSLPSPESWPGLIAPQIAETMPTGWVHEQLEVGRAIVLIDGLDEVSRDKQHLTYEWLNALMTTYRKSRYILSSRPESIGEEWNYVGMRDFRVSSAPIDMFLSDWHSGAERIRTLVQEQSKKEDELRRKYIDQLRALQNRVMALNNQLKSLRALETRLRKSKEVEQLNAGKLQELQQELIQTTSERQLCQKHLDSLRSADYFTTQLLFEKQRLTRDSFLVFRKQLLSEIELTLGYQVRFSEKTLAEIYSGFENEIKKAIARDDLESQLETILLEVQGQWLQRIKQEWMPVLTMQRMSDELVNSFVQHWHAAVAFAEGGLPSQYKQMEKIAHNFIKELTENDAMKKLATTPLLCALLCALHRERQQELPRDRINLYQTCLDIMTGKRDEKSGVDTTDYPKLNPKQKRYLLQDLAYWMMRNEYTATAPRQAAEQRLERRLTDLIDIEEATGHRTLEYLIDRTGIIREPTSNQIDFAHRTFQEFLCAEAIAFEGEIRAIASHISEPEWHEVIVLTAGLISQQDVAWLLNRMLLPSTKLLSDRGLEREKHILALDCLSTEPILNETAQAAIQKHLAKICPPRSAREAIIVSRAKGLAIPYLTNITGQKIEETLYSIDALVKIGTEEALPPIAQLTHKLETKFTNGMLGRQRQPSSVYKVGFHFVGNVPIDRAVGGVIRAGFPLHESVRNVVDLTQIKSRNSQNEIFTPQSESDVLSQIAMRLYRAWGVWGVSEAFAKQVLQLLVSRTGYLFLERDGWLPKAMQYIDLSGLEHIEIENCSEVQDWDVIAKQLWAPLFLTEITFHNNIDIRHLLPLSRLPRIRRINLPPSLVIPSEFKPVFQHINW